VVAANHPSFGVIVSRAWLETELVALGRNEFLRGYGNLPAPGGARSQGITATRWSEAKTDREPEGLLGIGVHVDDDGMTSSVVAAGVVERPGLTPLGVVEVIETFEGTAGVAELVLQLVELNDVGAVAFRSTGPGRDLADALERAGVEVLKVAGPDYTAACQRFKAGISSLRWSHRAQPSLDEAVRESTTKRSGNGWVWDGNCVPLHGASLAVWAFDHPGVQLGAFKIL